MQNEWALEASNAVTNLQHDSIKLFIIQNDKGSL